MGRHLALVRGPAVLPPLARHGHHADQHLRVHGAVGRGEAAAGELVGQDVLHPGRDVREQGGERAFGLCRRGVAHEDAEPFGALLDVAQQGQGGPLDEDARFGFLGQCLGDGAQQDPELVLDNLGVQAFLGAEVLVDHRFGDPGGRGDFLDGGSVQSAEGEEPAADADELAAALGPGHPDPRHVVGGPCGPAAAALRPSGYPCAVAHRSIMPQITRREAGSRPLHAAATLGGNAVWQN